VATWPKPSLDTRSSRNTGRIWTRQCRRSRPWYWGIPIIASERVRVVADPSVTLTKSPDVLGSFLSELPLWTPSLKSEDCDIPLYTLI